MQTKCCCIPRESGRGSRGRMKRRREASLEEGALGRVLGEAERALVGEHGLALASHGAQELGVRGMEEVVVGQGTGERFDLLKRGGRACDVSQCDGAVESYDGGV